MEEEKVGGAKRGDMDKGAGKAVVPEKDAFLGGGKEPALKGENRSWGKERSGEPRGKGFQLVKEGETPLRGGNSSSEEAYQGGRLGVFHQKRPH